MTNTDPVQRLMEMTDEVVPARLIAPVLKMSESILIHRVKTGQWNEDTLGKVVISGNRVKFFRRDFLEKCGFLQPEPEEPTERQLLMRIIELLTDLNMLIATQQKDPPVLQH